MRNHDRPPAALDITTDIYTGGGSPFDNPVDSYSLPTAGQLDPFQQVPALEQPHANPERERGGWLNKFRRSMGRSAETLVNLPSSEQPAVQAEKIDDPFGITSRVYEAPDPFGADSSTFNVGAPAYEAPLVDVSGLPSVFPPQEQSRFAAGGEVSQLVGSKAEVVSRLTARAQRALKHKAARKLPFVGKYVDAASSVVDVAHTVAGVAGHYDTVAGNVQGVYDQRNGLAGAAARTANEAVRDIAGAAGGAAAREIGRQVGITYENGRASVNVLTVGRAALKAFRNPAGFVGKTLKGAGNAAAVEARSRADDRLRDTVESAKSAARSMYEAPMF